MLQRNRAVVAIAFVAVLASAGPVAGAAAAKFILGAVNTAPATTTIQMAAPGAVLSLQNSGSGAAGGLSVTVPAGQAPITVSAGAGKATNLDADSVDGHDASDFVRGPGEGWHLIGTAGEPAWGRITLTSLDPFLPAGFTKDAFGFVHLQGHVLAALDQPDGCDTYSLFTLPSGYRPAAMVTEATVGLLEFPSTPVLAQIDILATGEVQLCSPRLLQYHWVSLDGLSFRAAP